MTKEEQQFNQWFDWYADGVKVFEEADMKQAYLQGRADLKKENAELTEQNTSLLTSVENLNKSVQELEAEVKEWKDKADLWCKTANLKDHNIMINKELEKENAELKNRDCWKSCEYANPKAELIAQHIKDVQQLTEAKEIIKDLLNLPFANNEEVFADVGSHLDKAEQFLKE